METDSFDKNCNWSFQKHVHTPGICGEKPTFGAKCQIRITNIQYKNLDVNNSEYLGSDPFNGSITIGDGDSCVDRLVEKTVMTMLPGEMSKVDLNFSLGSISCCIELLKVFNKSLIFTWTDEKKLEVAERYKACGVGLYQLERYVDAFLRFSSAFKLLSCITPANNSEGLVHEEAVMELRATLCNNMAMCQLVKCNWNFVVALCNKVLQLQANNVKALYRRSVAYLKLQQYENAKSDLFTVLGLDPGNTAAREKLNSLMNETKDIDEKYNELVKRMFS